MNDFTKEELKYILMISEEHEPFTMATHKVFHDKIQSIIDSYCEHKEFYNDGTLSATCTKCGYICKHDSDGGEVEVFVDTCSKCNALIPRIIE